VDALGHCHFSSKTFPFCASIALRIAEFIKSDRANFLRHDEGGSKSGCVRDAPNERPVPQSVTGNDWPVLLNARLPVVTLTWLRFSAVAA
jgi:hypothetical protein